MCYFRWLIKKLLGLIGQNIGGWSRHNRMLERRQRAARHEAARSDILSLSGKPRPCGDIQIIRNGLNLDVRVSQ